MVDRLCCASCGSNARKLKLVSCLHALCVACLDQHVAFDGGVQCPRCFTKTPIPTPRCPASALPDSYPRLVTGESTTTSTTSANLPVLCDDCAEEEPATASCPECGTSLCQTHAAAHPLFRATRHHRVASLSAAGQQETVDSVARVQRTAQLQHYCPLHPRQVVTKYCLQCHQLACQQCLDTGAHRQPEPAKHKVVPIERAVHTMRQKVDNNINSCLSKGTDSLSMALEKVREEIDHINEDAEHASEEIVEQFEKLRTALNSRESTLLEDVDRQRNSKLILLEGQVTRLEDGLLIGQAASEISRSCDDDTDFLKLAQWLNSALDRRKDVQDKDAEPCTRSQIVFGRVNVEEVASLIESTGIVQDFTNFSESLKVDIDDRYEGGKLRLLIKGALPLDLSPQCLDRLYFHISVQDAGNEKLPTTPLQQTSLERLESMCTSPSAGGPVTVSIQYAERHLQNSPLKAKIKPQPVFDSSWSHEDITISNGGRTITNNEGSNTNTAYTSRLTKTRGVSSIRVRMDNTSLSDVWICACSASKPSYHCVHRLRGEVYGWCGYTPDGGCKGGELSQRWRKGDVISLELDHVNQTLTGH
eukprot:scpid72815/ scgid27790/ E3 ubiquitin-protein ligase TRIM56; Tripartite motif-containing protein 56